MNINTYIKNKEKELSERYGAFEFSREIDKKCHDKLQSFLRSSLQELVGDIRKEVRDTFWKVTEDLENSTITHPAESEWNSGMRQAKAKVLTNLNHLLSLLP